MISTVTKAIISFVIVPGEETWVYHCSPEKKNESSVRKQLIEPAQSKFKTTVSAGKAVTKIYWDINGDMLVDLRLFGAHNDCRCQSGDVAMPRGRNSSS